MYLWFLLAGGVFSVMGLSHSALRRLPLSTAILYLALGFGVGTQIEGVSLHPVKDGKVLEVITEIAVIISLFTAGLKLRQPSLRSWQIPVRLASLAMVLSVAGVAAVGTWLLGLPLGAAVLLGAVLAPTDPVLASEVQVRDPDDEHRVRFGLTGEAGFNDGAAFPFVMLGLGLLGLHDLGEGGWRWWAVDLVYRTLAGLALGALVGHWVGRLSLWLRKRYHDDVLGEEFLALGLLALSYGLGLAIDAYAFLSVFAAALALSQVERRSHLDDRTAPALLRFAEGLELIAEAALVIMLGLLLASFGMAWYWAWFLPVLFLVIRPAAVNLALLGVRLDRVERVQLSWFGIRGIGSLYYLSYAISHGLPEAEARSLVGLTLLVVTASILVHGLTGTPLMRPDESKGPTPTSPAGT